MGLLVIIVVIYYVTSHQTYLASAGNGSFGENLIVLEMDANPLNPALLESKQLRKLWDHNEMVTDAVVNFQLGLAQMEDMHVWHKEDSQWLLVKTFFTDKLRKG